MRAYEARINRHDFDLMAPLIAESALFVFSDGTHRGLAEIRAAFEATWAALNNDTYRLSGLTWLARGAQLAACTYRFDWSTVIDGHPQAGHGRGTSVMQCGADGRWRVIHEHLSAAPDGPAT